jgi:hypothetical protein
MRFLSNVGAAISGVLVIIGALVLVVWLSQLAAEVVP